MATRTLAQWQRDQRLIEALSALTNRAGELNSYLQRIAASVCELLEVDITVVTLCQQDYDRVVASSDGEEDDHLYQLHGTLTGTVVDTGRSLIVEDCHQHPEYGAAPDGYLCYLGVPLRTTHGEIIGTICSFHSQSRHFTQAEVQTAELFAERAATAIENYRLYQQQQQFNETLEAEVIKRTVELRAAQAKLIENERLAAIGEFAAMIVHEIRNPLTTVKMGLTYCNSIDLPEAAHKRIELATSEADRLEKLLNEILLYSKPQVLQLAEVDISDLLHEIVHAMQDTPEAAHCRLEVQSVVPAVQVLGDRDKLKQVLINLIRNACEAVTPGSCVTCSIYQQGEPAMICVQVHNGGEPIPAQAIAKLTEPFYSTKPEGTGLGLAIVKRIVQSHGGNLHIESTAAEGTTVSITLPQVATD